MDRGSESLDETADPYRSSKPKAAKHRIRATLIRRIFNCNQMMKGLSVCSIIRHGGLPQFCQPLRNSLRDKYQFDAFLLIVSKSGAAQWSANRNLIFLQKSFETRSFRRVYCRTVCLQPSRC